MDSFFPYCVFRNFFYDLTQAFTATFFPTNFFATIGRKHLDYYLTAFDNASKSTEIHASIYCCKF